MLQRIKRFLNEEMPSYFRAKDKKPYFQQYKEMSALWSYYRYLPYHYIKDSIYLKSFDGDVLDYLPPKWVERYQMHINPANSRANADDKIIFNELMIAAGIPIIPIYFVIDRHSGILHLDSNTTTQFDRFVNELSHCKSKHFFVKPYNALCGEGIFRFELQDGKLLIENKVYDKAAFFNTLFSKHFKKFIVQPAVEQHQVLHKLCPSSINTVRIHTFALNNEIIINSALLRMGNGTSYVDNATKGGFFAKIDIDTGQLASTATNKTKYGGIVTDCHPATRVKFEGITIPYWSEVLQTIKVGVEQLKPLKWLGWDVVIGIDGPIILETNQNFGVFLCQYGANGLRKTALGKEIITKFLPSK
ncbi:hypothetical protein MNBD_GAMMA16-743 [hydrothermal vent metagenome]|uniref:Alpha-L-glutamate ligase-related protein ATP-grasp domain-containing protein n=1 Tax=hydrothermal vent metagenome TaxID=652676 RepID=A0A3B0YTA9_9ZZZZ